MTWHALELSIRASFTLQLQKWRPKIMKVTIYQNLVNILEKFKRVGMRFRGRPFQQTCQQAQLTTPDTYQSNMAIGDQKNGNS